MLVDERGLALGRNRHRASFLVGMGGLPGQRPFASSGRAGMSSSAVMREAPAPHGASGRSLTPIPPVRQRLFAAQTDARHCGTRGGDLPFPRVPELEREVAM